MTRARAVLAAGALALALLIAGCGGGDGSRFHEEISAIEHAVDAGDRAAALGALDVLRSDVEAARQAGEIDDARYAELSGLLQESRVLLDAVLPAPTTTPPPTEPGRDDEGDDDNEGGKEEEDGKDDENDGKGGKGGKGEKKDEDDD